VCFLQGEIYGWRKLTHEGIGTFPANNPDFKKENFIAG